MTARQIRNLHSTAIYLKIVENGKEFLSSPKGNSYQYDRKVRTSE
jgi:hypothetical protein